MTTQSEPRSEPSAKSLYLGINKAENMPYPEVFASTLAKTAYSSKDWNDDVSGNKKPGVVYRRLSKKEVTTVEFIEVDPYQEKARTDSAKWEDFLKRRFFCDDSRASIMARAAADSFAGTLSKKQGVSQLASPMSPGLALLQDTRGVTGKQNPYDVASALERMYELGGPRLIEDGHKRTAASRWAAASVIRVLRL